MSALLGTIALRLAELAFIARAIFRPHRNPSSRVAWVAVIAALPVVGILAYVLLGETSIGRRRIARARQVASGLPSPASLGPSSAGPCGAELPERAASLFRFGATVSGFPAVGGNRAELMADSNAAIDAIVADMDAAEDHVHLTFYIWLADRNGMKVIEALKRAAARGVTCRVITDGLGSRALIGSAHWRELEAAGVRTAVALGVGNRLLLPLQGRIDLRNHRKIVVIDGRITYCGSQNCADPEFRVKAAYAPWVDVMVRFEGPVALQNQHVFASDWMTCVSEDVRGLFERPPPATGAGFPAQVIATGPTMRASAMPETFQTLMYAARDRLVITTPYYVPNESMQAALCASAQRGVDTTIVFPARNDSFITAAASRSYYRDLLAAGVRIHEYAGGLLHAKTMTVDGDVALIGSANMDRRSFDLNYENNILLFDEDFTSRLRSRQEAFLASSTEVTMEQVEAWSVGRRLWNNSLGMLGPLL